MSHEFLSFLLALAIIIAAAKTGGYISVRLNQPSVLGELLVGIILGPTLLNIMQFDLLNGGGHSELVSEVIHFLSELGVILLMFVAGLELHIGELMKSGRVSALSGSFGVFVPLLMGWGVATLFGTNQNEAWFIGLALSATSVSISAQTLLELGVLRTRVGLAMLGAAVFDDILVLLLLSTIFIVVSGTGGVATIALTMAKMAIFLIAATAIGKFVFPRAIHLADQLLNRFGLLAVALVFMLLFAWAAEYLGGLASITGAFVAGLFISPLPAKGRIEEGVLALAYGFFVPIFFINIGLSVNLTKISGSGWILALALTVIAVISKILGSGLGAKLSHFSNLESLQLGIGMVSRGEVGLIVAAFALANGMITNDLFSIVVFMVIVATLLTPPMLRASFSKKETAVSA